MNKNLIQNILERKNDLLLDRDINNIAYSIKKNLKYAVIELNKESAVEVVNNIIDEVFKGAIEHGVLANLLMTLGAIDEAFIKCYDVFFPTEIMFYDFYIECVKNRVPVMRYANTLKKLSREYEVGLAIEYLKNGGSLRFLPKNIDLEKSFLLNLLENSPSEFQYMEVSLFEAFERNIEVLNYIEVGELELMDIEKLIEMDERCIPYVIKSYKNYSNQVVIDFIKRFPKYFIMMPKECQSVEVCKRLVKHDYKLVEFIPIKILTLQLSLSLLCIDKKCFRYLPTDIQLEITNMVDL